MNVQTVLHHKSQFGLTIKIGLYSVYMLIVLNNSALWSIKEESQNLSINGLNTAKCKPCELTMCTDF